jgi:uncharacterized membrane protein
MLQELIEGMGYDVGVIDGVFGPATKAAVQQLQRDHGLDADGIAGPLTMQAISDAYAWARQPTPAPGPAPAWPGRYLLLSDPMMNGGDVNQWQGQMANRGLRSFVALLVTSLLLLAGCARRIEGAGGERLGVAVDVNADNMVVTAGFVGDRRVAYLYNAVTRDLDLVAAPDGADFVPAAISDRGAIVGAIITGTGREQRSRAVRWLNGFLPLPLPDGTFQSWATDINVRGEIVINAYSPSGGPGDGAYVWSPNGRLVRLADPPGAPNGRPSVAEAINDLGVVVGASGNGTPAGQERALQWSATHAPELLGGPGDTSRALDINEAGTIVGTSVQGAGAGQRAAAWFTAAHTFLDLGPGQANGLNNANVVVGQFARTDGTSRAGAWFLPAQISIPLGDPGPRRSSLATAVNDERAVGATDGEAIEFTLVP